MGMKEEEELTSEMSLIIEEKLLSFGKLRSGELSRAAPPGLAMAGRGPGMGESARKEQDHCHAS